MPTLQVLINEILAISKADSAVASMTKYGVNPQMFGNAAQDITNCYLTAEYVAKALKPGCKFVEQTQMGVFGNSMDASDLGSELSAGKEKLDVWFLKSVDANSAHNLIVARHVSLWALLHGWDRVWSIFPKLNDGGRAYILWGQDMGKMIIGLLQGDAGNKVHKVSVKWPNSWAVKRLD